MALINFSWLSTKLTGNRTQITRRYEQSKYAPDFEYLINFENDYEKGIYNYHFKTKRENIKHDLGTKAVIYADIELNILTKEVTHIYIYVEKESVFSKEEFDIHWKGTAIKEIEIDFSSKTLKLL